MNTYWTSGDGRIDLCISIADARACSHPGFCDDDVAALLREPYIADQASKIDPAHVRRVLAEYGAWDEDELADHDENLVRLVWIAACDLAEEASQ